MESNNQNSSQNNRNRKSRNKKKFSVSSTGNKGVRPPKPKSNQPGQKPGKSNSFKSKKPSIASKSRRSSSRKKSNNGGGSTVVRKYEHFMEMYLNTRKKLFTVFFSNDTKQKNKCEKNYTTAIKQLREFEDGLEGDTKKQFYDHIIVYPEDNSVSGQMKESGELEDWEAEIVANKDPEGYDPHELPTQRDLAFLGDSEETVATEDDLKQFIRIKE